MAGVNASAIAAYVYAIVNLSVNSAADSAVAELTFSGDFDAD